MTSCACIFQKAVLNSKKGFSSCYGVCTIMKRLTWSHLSQFYVGLWCVLGKCQQCSQIQREIQPSRSVTVQANETHCSACSEAQECRGRAKAANLAVTLHSHMCSLSGTLCEHKWNTHKFAESGQRRQIKVDPRKKILLSPSLSWRRDKEKFVLEQLKWSLLLLGRLVLRAFAPFVVFHSEPLWFGLKNVLPLFISLHE